MRISGSVALVTGASRGIGKETARALAAGGASLALVARNKEQLEELVKEFGTDRAVAISADLSDIDQCVSAFQAAMDRFGRVDILVNNAGIADPGDLLAVPVEHLARVVDVNYRAAVVLTRLAAEQMAKQREGHIVNVASLAGVAGIPGASVYAGTKAALRLFTSSLRQEMREQGIHLTEVVPGFISTDMLAQVESNPRVDQMFNRARRLRMMTDTPAPVVARAIVHAIEARRAVVVIPRYARPMFLPLQGLSRQITHWLTPR